MVTFLASLAGGGDGDDATDDRQRSEEARSLVRSILNGLQEPAVIVDADAEITALNDQAMALYDTTAADAVGQRPRALHDDEHASDIVTEALEAGDDIQQREETLDIAGTETPVERTVTLLYDEADNCVGAMLMAKDVTERRRQAAKKEALEAYQARVTDDLQAKLDQLADGDLTIDPTVAEPDADYEELEEVYEEFTDMNENLTRAVENIRTLVRNLTTNADGIAETSEGLSANAEEVTAAIDQIDASSTELAGGAEDLASETQRASRHVDDLSASIEEITATVQQIDARSAEAAEIADDGVEEGETAVGRIRRATDASSTVAQRITSLEESMQEVGDIIGVINDITEQTNMLALNANIEAARAAQGGEGFAVVANEIKSLAEESSESAEEIQNIVEDVQTQTADLVDSIEDANGEVEAGADAVEGMVDRLEQIQDRIAETSDGVAEISGAVESQAENAEQVSAVVDDAAGIAEEITASIQQVSSGVDEQADAMDQVARSAQRLSGMSDAMFTRIEQFKIEADGSAAVD